MSVRMLCTRNCFSLRTRLPPSVRTDRYGGFRNSTWNTSRLIWL